MLGEMRVGTFNLLLLLLRILSLIEMAISIIVIGKSATVAAVTRRSGKTTAIDHYGH